MFTKRTDLAIEAHELWQESAGKTTRLAGVKATEKKIQGYPVTQVDILDREGEAALGKPAGSYRTLDLTDAMPQHFSGFRPVAALRPGVLGTTGVESAEAVRGLVDRLHPSVVIAVDALASRRVGRVCCTVQFSDTGIIPGSGVGNHRSALNRETLGVPVLAVGVPTVVDAATLAADLLEESGLPEPDMETLRSRPENLMVTPRDIDQQVRDLGKVIGYGINWALQDLEIEEINALLS